MKGESMNTSMKYTESHFGLIADRDGTSISADAGYTWQRCPLNDADFAQLKDDVECWLEREMDAQETEDFEAICGR